MTKRRNSGRLLSYEGHTHTYGVPNFEEQVWTRLDEFVVASPKSIHFEHMDGGAAYLAIYGADGHDMHFHVFAEGGQLHMKLDWCEPEEHTDAFVEACTEDQPCPVEVPCPDCTVAGGPPPFECGTCEGLEVVLASAPEQPPSGGAA